MEEIRIELKRLAGMIEEIKTSQEQILKILNPGKSTKVKREELSMIVYAWKEKTGIPIEDRAWDKVHWPRVSKTAKMLFQYFGNAEDAVNCIEHVYDELVNKGLSCTIETVLKRSDEYKKMIQGRNNEFYHRKSYTNFQVK